MFIQLWTKWIVLKIVQIPSFFQPKTNCFCTWRLIVNVILTTVCDHWDSAPPVALWLCYMWPVNNTLNKITRERPIAAEHQMDCKQKHKLKIAEGPHPLCNWWTFTNVLWFYFTDPKFFLKKCGHNPQHKLSSNGRMSLILRGLLKVIIDESHS